MNRLPTWFENPRSNSSLNKTASIKALSSMKYQSVGRHEALKSAELNKSETTKN